MIMTKPRLAILGASGHGKVVAEIAELRGYEVIFFDDSFPDKKKLEHWIINGNTNQLISRSNEFNAAAVAIGNNAIRAQKLGQLKAHFPLPTLAHPASSISLYAEVAEACVIMAGAVVNPFATIGFGAIINTNSVIEHDCSIGEYVHVCPQTSLAGGVVLKDLVWLGLGSCVIQQITIGTKTTIGAGSVVTHNIPAGNIAYGSPAKIIRKNNA